MGVDSIVRTPAAAVFLDRDGVINRTFVRDGVPHPPANVDEVELLPGVAEATALLAAGGLGMFVATNQPDVARGTQTRNAVESINRWLAEQLPLSGVFVCYHDTADGCDCRKPKPGLLLQAAQQHHVDLSSSFMIGDRWSDVAAGRAVGCKTFLLDTPYNERSRCEPDYIVRDLLQAAHIITTKREAR